MDVINLVMPILIISAVYFFILKPQKDLQKKQDGFLEGLAKGKDVVTTSGIHGRINKIDGDIITLQVDTKTFIRLNKGAISREMSEQASTQNDKSGQRDSNTTATKKTGQNQS